MGRDPSNIETTLRKAADDPDFKRALLEKRSKAAEEAGILLSYSEEEILDTLTAEVLEQTIDNIARSPSTAQGFTKRMLAKWKSEQPKLPHVVATGIRPELSMGARLVMTVTVLALLSGLTLVVWYIYYGGTGP